MLKEATRLRHFGVKSVSTNPAKRTIDALTVSKKEDYYKNLEDSQDKNEVKPPGWDEALPFECIPGPKPLPIIGNLWRFFPYIGEYHNTPVVKFHELLRNKYGNIVALKGVTRNPMVFVFDVNDMEKNLRNEGQFPLRIGLESMKYYRTVTRKDVFNGAIGLLNLQGEEWYKFRSAVNPILMQPRVTQQYIENMDIVASELVDNIRYFSTQNENNEMPQDFQNELYKWALESIGVIALDKHLGCLNLNAPKDSEPQKLIDHLNELFMSVEVVPPPWDLIETSSWKRFVKVVDFITDTCLKYIEEAMNKIVADDTPEHKLSVIQRLAKQDKNIAVAMVLDMIMAGIDTTGKTMAAALYFLARNPEKQQKLREEVFRNLPERESSVTTEILNNSPYLKAVIKEAIRIAPVAAGNFRTTVKDLVLGGYRVPKSTDVISSHIMQSNSEDQFKDHEKFIPERWLRMTEDEYSHKNAHPFAYLPFGFGPRSCVGKRLANLELEVGLSKIIRNFELSWNHKDMTFSGKFVYGVEDPLKLTVKPL